MIEQKYYTGVISIVLYRVSQKSNWGDVTWVT